MIQSYGVGQSTGPLEEIKTALDVVVVNIMKEEAAACRSLRLSILALTIAIALPVHLLLTAVRGSTAQGLAAPLRLSILRLTPTL